MKSESGRYHLEQNELIEALREWFQSPLGEQVSETQNAILEQLLPGYFGYHLLQMSIQSGVLYESSPIRHKFKLDIHPADSACCAASPAALPFANDSVDVVLMHHLLEYSNNPQQLLREASRVSLPMGHVVIVGFNPHSLWGLCKPLGRLRKHPLWSGNFIRPGRVMDWLNLLNFKIDRAQYCTYGLPVVGYSGQKADYSNGLSRNANLPFGAVYVIVARKQVGTLTPIKPVWKSQTSFGRLAAVRPLAGRNASPRTIRVIPPESKN
ncbi:MAG: methyltransferase domain-containing protein [Pseudomonadales bacterium]|nr:methyltransferase domain-containing protein [Pseudomonadales bacterium]